MKRKLTSSGFTLIELMLAMTIFSLIFILTTVGFVGVNRTYTRGAIKKQLSESVQNVSDELSAALRVPQPTQPTHCISGGDSCPAGSLNAICMTGVRYVWPTPLASNAGGLYRDTQSCDSNFSLPNAVEIVDPRFVVEDLKVTAAAGSQDIYQVKGVIHTSDVNSLTTTDNSETIDRNSTSFDPYKLRCKGTSAGSIVQTCAVESFDSIITSRGELQ